MASITYYVMGNIIGIFLIIIGIAIKLNKFNRITSWTLFRRKAVKDYDAYKKISGNHAIIDGVFFLALFALLYFNHDIASYKLLIGIYLCFLLDSLIFRIVSKKYYY